MINKTIREKIEQYLKEIKLNSIIPTKEFKILCGDTKDSYIPSDYCYNRCNNGINFEKILISFYMLQKVNTNM